MVPNLAVRRRAIEAGKQLGQITNNRKFQACKKVCFAPNIAHCKSLLRGLAFGRNSGLFRVFSVLEAGRTWPIVSSHKGAEVGVQ